MRTKLLIAGMLAAGAWLACPIETDAQVPAWGYGGFYGYRGNVSDLYNNLPRHALYPPVYYSHPVSRPYGLSPFAYSPLRRYHTVIDATGYGYAAPEEAAPTPKLLRNPHVPRAAEPEPNDSSWASPLRNPYVDAANPQLANLPTIRANPHVATAATANQLPTEPAAPAVMIYPTRG